MTSSRTRDAEARKHIQTDGVVVHKGGAGTWTSTDESGVELVDEALIVLTKAYSHTGHPLITPENPKFGGFPGVHLLVRANGAVQDVYLSPIHGHHEKIGGEGIPDGTRCEVLCPGTGEPLPDAGTLPNCPGTMRKIFLTPELSDAHMAALCDTWGCSSSRVIDPQPLDAYQTHHLSLLQRQGRKRLFEALGPLRSAKVVTG